MPWIFKRFYKSREFQRITIRVGEGEEDGRGERNTRDPMQKSPRECACVHRQGRGGMSAPKSVDGKDGNDQGAVGGDEGRIEDETNPGLDRHIGKLKESNESNEGEEVKGEVEGE